jgi:hypothetical protein
MPTRPLLAGLLAVLPLAAGAARLEDYPATEFLPTFAEAAVPDFEGRDAWAARYRTMIRQGVEDGPDFAGHWSLVQVGCGTGCSTTYMVDHATGEVLPFPYGPERNGVGLVHDVASRLVQVSWLRADGLCERHDLVWEGGRFRMVEREIYEERDFIAWGWSEAIRYLL